MSPEISTKLRIPTFEEVKQYYPRIEPVKGYLERDRGENPVTAEVICPYCGEIHQHSPESGPRHPHCGTNVPLGRFHPYTLNWQYYIFVTDEKMPVNERKRANTKRAYRIKHKRGGWPGISPETMGGGKS